MFQKAMKYIANYICGVFNLYLIPRIVGYNYDTTEFPEMRVRNIGETKDLQMWASAHANLISQGAITVDLESENWYRENLDMPYIGERPEAPEPDASQNGSQNGANVNLPGQPDTTGKGSVEAKNRHTGTGNTGTTPGAESVS
jgi:hypothetical protein